MSGAKIETGICHRENCRKKNATEENHESLNILNRYCFTMFYMRSVHTVEARETHRSEEGFWFLESILYIIYISHRKKWCHVECAAKSQKHNIQFCTIQWIHYQWRLKMPSPLKPNTRSQVRHLGIQAAWIRAKSCSSHCSCVEHCVASEQVTYSARLMAQNANFEHSTTITGEIFMTLVKMISLPDSFRKTSMSQQHSTIPKAHSSTMFMSIIVLDSFSLNKR